MNSIKTEESCCLALHCSWVGSKVNVVTTLTRKRLKCWCKHLFPSPRESYFRIYSKILAYVGTYIYLHITLWHALSSNPVFLQK